MHQIADQKVIPEQKKPGTDTSQNKETANKPSIENQFRIAVPRTSFADLSVIAGTNENSASTRECAMDSQFQLHQDMVFQNNYLLQRNVAVENTMGKSLGDNLLKPGSEVFLITSSEDDIERIKNLQKKKSSRKRVFSEQSPTLLISSVLSAQNVVVLGGHDV